MTDHDDDLTIPDPNGADMSDRTDPTEFTTPEQTAPTGAGVSDPGDRDRDHADPELAGEPVDATERLELPIEDPAPEPRSMPAPPPGADPPVVAVPHRHNRRFHLTHAVFSVVFIALGLFGLDGDTDRSSSWVWVALLAGAGIAGLVAVVNGIMADPRAD